jgi:hypothetical protein
MAASNEWERYHLTPRGWIRGSSKTDGQPEETVPAPVDTLYTITWREYQPTGLSLPSSWWEPPSYEGSDLAVIDLLKKYGELPH